jgi:hypothetical protein
MKYNFHTKNYKSDIYSASAIHLRMTAILLFLMMANLPVLSDPVLLDPSLPIRGSSGYLPSATSHLRLIPSSRLLSSGYGPEDIVLDSIHTPPRLLVSCASRRSEYPVYGEIESIDPVSGSRLVLSRIGEPKGFAFRPHGISLVLSGEFQYLYVISHDDQNGKHPIVQYQVDGNNLVLVRILETKLLVSPNALQAYPDGSLLVCNDAGTRNSMKEKILGQKLGNILFYDGRGNWSIVAAKLAMPAGLTGMGDQVFVSAALENTLFSFRLVDGQLSERKQVCRIKGPDNIRIHNNKLIVTSHSKPIKFILHTRKKSQISPSLVLSIDPKTGKSEQLFYDKGNLISAASVALIFNNQLVIGQIFEPFIYFFDLHNK